MASPKKNGHPAPAPKKKNGRPTKLVPPDPTAVMSMLARLGATNKEIAATFGVSTEALRNWRKSNPDLSCALKRGKELSDEKVVQSLFRKACSGDVTACIFWLKNRQPLHWRDRREATFTGTMDTSHVTTERSELSVELAALTTKELLARLPEAAVRALADPYADLKNAAADPEPGDGEGGA